MTARSVVRRKDVPVIAIWAGCERNVMVSSVIRLDTKTDVAL